jgi:hypothetical protein
MDNFTKCESIGKRFQCLCPKSLFLVRETQSLSGSLRREYCEDIDECSEEKCRRDHKVCDNIISVIIVVVVKDIKW